MRQDPTFADPDSDDRSEDRPDAADIPARAPSRLRVARRCGQALLACGAIAVLSLFARGSGAPAPVSPSPPEAAAASAFVPSVVARTERPAVALTMAGPRFRLDDPESLEPVRAGATRLNPATGQREDILIQGGFPMIEAPYLRLTLTETPEPGPPQSLFVTLARRAADGQGLAVIRTGERGSIETKFGPVETLDITLGGDGRRQCTGFASLTHGPIRLDGWLCAPLGQAPEPRTLACALDKVALTGDASSELETAFAALDGRRDPGCVPAPVALRDATSETGSLPGRRARKNEAKLRPSSQARP